MKRFFFTIFIFLLFLIPASTHATTFPYSNTVSGVTTDISITSTATTASIVINIKNPNKVSIQNKKLVVYSNSTCQAPFLLNETISMTRIDTLSKTFFVGQTTPLKPDTTYCFRYSDTGWDNETFKTDTIVPPTTFADAWPLTPSTLGDKSAILGGKIDVSNYTGNIKNLTIELQYSSTPDTFDKKVQSLSNTITNAVGIASDGTYYFNLGTTLTPGATYYIREVLTDTVSAYTEQKTASFVNTDKGLALEGSVAEQNYFEKKSYRLLAPFPGLAVLLDPSQCAALSAEELAGKICSINDLLNFIFKILIGVTAVILVFRLVFEGYTILTTDVPFLNVKAKNGFFTALAGLLLALSAWLILNTVNPKLVSNEFSIEGVSVGVIEEQLALAQAGYDAIAAKNLSPDAIKNIIISYKGKYKYIQDEYIPARDSALPTASKGVKILITAHTAFEGFYPGTKSYRTNNPGNIGNTDDGSTVTYPNLGEGIQKQYSHINGIVNGTNPNYKIGKTYSSIGGVYDGSLYQYIKIYATGARQSNTYLSYIISYFAKNGYTITGYTKMSEIAALK